MFNKIPTDPCGNYGRHLWLSSPAYATGVVNQGFLNFHSKMASLVRENSMSPPPAYNIGNNQKSPPQADMHALYQFRRMCPAFSHPDKR